MLLYVCHFRFLMYFGPSQIKKKKSLVSSFSPSTPALTDARDSEELDSFQESSSWAPVNLLIPYLICWFFNVLLHILC